MAHFAQIDENNTVIDIIVIDNNDILDHNGNESELLGIELCRSLLGENTKWIQTSYNDKFRGKYASLGDSYLYESDVFLSPKPFESWVLNTTTKSWQAPIEKPVVPENYFCIWDEEDQQWNVQQNRFHAK